MSNNFLYQICQYVKVKECWKKENANSFLDGKMIDSSTTTENKRRESIILIDKKERLRRRSGRKRKLVNEESILHIDCGFYANFFGL